MIYEPRLIKQDFYNNWVSPNGLALLSIQGPENSNGILFLAIFLMLLKQCDCLDQTDLNKAYLALEKIRVQPGLYKRAPGNDSLEAHDDYVGICAISVLFDFIDARSITDFGTRMGFSYDNITPDKPDPRSTRQGGEIAYYKLCAGYIPTLWEYIWLILGLVLASFKGTPSVINLAWLRIKTLLIVSDRFSTNLFGIIPVSMYFTSLIFNFNLRRRYGNLQGSFAQYFEELHPIRRLAKELSL
jgi:hypothetical protein